MKTELFNVFTSKQIQAIKDCICHGYWGNADCLFNGNSIPVVADGYCTASIYKGKHFSNKQISGICSGIAEKISKHNLNWIFLKADYWEDNSGGMIFFHYERMGTKPDELREWANKQDAILITNQIMSKKTSLNKTLLNLIIYIQDTKKQAISEGILFENEDYDWYRVTQDVYYELNKKLFEKAGIVQNQYNFEKILNYPVKDEILNTKYEQLGKFLF